MTVVIQMVLQHIEPVAFSLVPHMDSMMINLHIRTASSSQIAATVGS